MDRINIHTDIWGPLKEWLNGHPQNHERGAIILFKRLSRKVRDIPRSDRLIAVETILMDDQWIVESSRTQFTINMRKFPEIYFRCESEELELGFIHSHPENSFEFSPMDDRCELSILKGLSGCNSPDSRLISLILSKDFVNCRIRMGSQPELTNRVKNLIVLGSKLEIHCVDIDGKSIETLKRQEAAFGKPFNAKLQSLRVAVVGLGGIGSPVATLLARSGVGEIILIDGDDLEATNMNRVRGYAADKINKNKAESLKEFIDSLKMSNITLAISDYLHESGEAIDALSTVDVIFGCTDDATGRDYMNQCLYYYSNILIDCGIAAYIDSSEVANPYLRDYNGRISCILPRNGACLRCQRVIDDRMIQFEEAVRANPELLKLDPETLEREYYLRGGGVQAPGVGPFTSATADFACTTLFNLITGFRNPNEDLRSDNIWIDFVHLYIRSNNPIENGDCIYCETHEIDTLSEKKYRLNTPSLGEPIVYE